MCNTNNESTANNAYLLEYGRMLERISYRKNLLQTLQNRLPDVFSDFSESDLEQRSRFRAFITLAEEHGYTVYQLTRL